MWYLMVYKKFSCPLCGHIVKTDRIDEKSPIEIFTLHGLGRGRGFRLNPIEAPDIVRRVKMKILSLYHRFFGNEFPITEEFPIKEVFPITEEFSIKESVHYVLRGD